MISLNTPFILKVNLEAVENNSSITLSSFWEFSWALEMPEDWSSFNHLLVNFKWPNPFFISKDEDPLILLKSIPPGLNAPLMNLAESSSQDIWCMTIHLQVTSQIPRIWEDCFEHKLWAQLQNSLISFAHQCEKVGLGPAYTIGFHEIMGATHWENTASSDIQTWHAFREKLILQAEAKAIPLKTNKKTISL